MGTFSVPIEIGDPQGRKFELVDALVDTGATLTSVPSSLLARLGVAPTRSGRFALANDQRIDMSMGETRIRVNGMEITTWILFGEEESSPLLGALALEGLLLGVDPFNRRLIPVEGLLMSSTGSCRELELSAAEVITTQFT